MGYEHDHWYVAVDIERSALNQKKKEGGRKELGEYFSQAESYFLPTFSSGLGPICNLGDQKTLDFHKSWGLRPKEGCLIAQTSSPSIKEALKRHNSVFKGDDNGDGADNNHCLVEHCLVAIEDESGNVRRILILEDSALGNPSLTFVWSPSPIDPGCPLFRDNSLMVVRYKKLAMYVKSQIVRSVFNHRTAKSTLSVV